MIKLVASARPGHSFLHDFEAGLPDLSLPGLVVRVEGPEQAVLDPSGPGMVRATVVVQPVLPPWGPQTQRVNKILRIALNNRQ
jgi:hypothetical protein